MTRVEDLTQENEIWQVKIAGDEDVCDSNVEIILQSVDDDVPK